MASAARRARGAARRPFAVLASPYPAITSAESVAAIEVVPFARSAVREMRRRQGGRQDVRRRGVLPFPVSENPAATASRSRMSSFSQKRCSTPTTTAPLRGLLEDRGGKVRASLSSPFDEADQAFQERRSGEAASRKRMVTRSAAMEEAMLSLTENGKGRVKYLVGTFERLLSLSLADGGPEARSGGATKGRRTKSEATPTTRTSSASSPTPATAEEIDVSYPSSEVSFPAIAGVACILEVSDRTSMIRAARELQRQRRCNSTGSPQRTCSRKVASVMSQRPFNLMTEQRGKAKEENFVQRMRKMQLDEEMIRNPLAQGLPFTTGEPEYPVKPPTKEPT